MPDWLIGCALAAGLLHVGVLLVKGYRSGRMARFDMGAQAGRHAKPALFWFNTALNVGWFGVLPAILRT